MAVREARVAVDLVGYIDSLMGRRVDYETLDCVRFVRGWLPDAPAPDARYDRDTWIRCVADHGGLNWHLRTSDYLAVRDGMARIGDIVWRRNEADIPMLGIARDRVFGHFLVETPEPGHSPVGIMPFERTPIWAGRLP